MPNHVTNILTIRASDETVRAVKDRIAGRVEKADINGKPTGEFLELPFDFNRLIPMAPELRETVSDGLVMQVETRSGRRTIGELIESIKKSKPDEVENFCRAIKNLNKHGAACWYDWSVEHWGTKWNAYSAAWRAPAELKFETAWSHPAPVYRALSETFPDVDFEIKYADEDYGHNCDHFRIRNGEIKRIATFDQGTPESSQFAYAVHEVDPKELEEDE